MTRQSITAEEAIAQLDIIDVFEDSSLERCLHIVLNFLSSANCFKNDPEAGDNLPAPSVIPLAATDRNRAGSK